MSSFFWVPAGTESGDTNSGMPGAAPNGTQMQGNPNLPNGAPDTQAPLPQNSSAQLLATQVASANLPVNLQPTNVLQGTGPGTTESRAGGDSLLAMQARGQLLRSDSTYGQGGYVPANGSGFVPSASPAVAQPTGPASGVTYSNNGNYSGM